ncbi:hypothetical protein [Asanoa siamensis]|uniref:Zinc finger protein n=1 Tax=Asanoa siamensis TaxID=926357 RepID=A0ABQ4CIM5_9ACTN|nr:hypothetical protein [Asanoa siamensis]GIF71151.1 hypothetical protein Asi02nite_06690 [Asanoa siamensis]
MSEVDYDLLADYVGGALTGTPDSDRVAELVATDPDWAAEHGLLVAALAVTADDLAVFAELTAEPMPADVTERLLAALPGAVSGSDRASASLADHASGWAATSASASDVASVSAADHASDPAASTSASASDPASDAGHGSEAVAASDSDAASASAAASASERASASAADHASGSSARFPAETVAGPARGNRAPRQRPGGAAGRPPARPGDAGRRRHRWLTWAAPTVVAIAMLAFAGVWISQSVGTGLTNAESGAADTAAQAPAVGGDVRSVPRQTSGRDYTSGDIAGGPGAASRSSVSSKPAAPFATEEGGQNMATDGAAVAPELLRLSGAAALDLCVDAIQRAHGQGPITVDVADFAAYDGRPALVVFFTDSAGGRWGWVVGPDCGPGGTDELFRSRVA